MSHSIHHVPGRLRIKSPRFKRNEHAASRAKGHLDRLTGVLSTDVNTVTGSLLIKYDTRQVAARTLLDSLHSEGHLNSRQERESLYTGPGIGQAFSDSVVNKLMETVIERSATALVAAIL